ncbi:unnamed protein product [Didymodactylos carnosus]|nr:unnamed protein product [Didymodactylos carnosus]CAF4301090.1 unnamed protein product [Didymodactylos carnosus]
MSKTTRKRRCTSANFHTDEHCSTNDTKHQQQISLQNSQEERESDNCQQLHKSSETEGREKKRVRFDIIEEPIVKFIHRHDICEVDRILQGFTSYGNDRCITINVNGYVRIYNRFGFESELLLCVDKIQGIHYCSHIELLIVVAEDKHQLLGFRINTDNNDEKGKVIKQTTQSNLKSTNLLTSNFKYLLHVVYTSQQRYSIQLLNSRTWKRLRKYEIDSQYEPLSLDSNDRYMAVTIRTNDESIQMRTLVYNYYFREVYTVDYDHDTIQNDLHWLTEKQLIYLSNETMKTVNIVDDNVTIIETVTHGQRLKISQDGQLLWLIDEQGRLILFQIERV